MWQESPHIAELVMTREGGGAWLTMGFGGFGGGGSHVAATCFFGMYPLTRVLLATLAALLVEG